MAFVCKDDSNRVIAHPATVQFAIRQSKQWPVARESATDPALTPILFQSLNPAAVHRKSPVCGHEDEEKAEYAQQVPVIAVAGSIQQEQVCESQKLDCRRESVPVSQSDSEAGGDQYEKDTLHCPVIRQLLDP